MKNENLTINLTAAQVNVVMNALAELPLKITGPTFWAIDRQLSEQNVKPEDVEAPEQAD